jgi:uncharacterized protein (DUF952 family)
MGQIKKPKYLYKVLSLINWQASQNKDNIVLSHDDINFVHFATRKQLDKILKKYWAQVPDYVILQVITKKLIGTLVYEVNLGGSNRYYHLYNGYIPLNSINKLEKTQN